MGQTRPIMFQNTNNVTQRRIQRGGETTIVFGEKYCTTVTARSDFLTQNAQKAFNDGTRRGSLQRSHSLPGWIKGGRFMAGKNK